MSRSWDQLLEGMGQFYIEIFFLLFSCYIEKDINNLHYVQV